MNGFLLAAAEVYIATVKFVWSAFRDRGKCLFATCHVQMLTESWHGSTLQCLPRYLTSDLKVLALGPGHSTQIKVEILPNLSILVLRNQKLRKVKVALKIKRTATQKLLRNSHQIPIRKPPCNHFNTCSREPHPNLTKQSTQCAVVGRFRVHVIQPYLIQFPVLGYHFYKVVDE